MRFFGLLGFSKGEKMSDLPKYEYLETTAVKGFEAKTKKKYSDEGWELVSEEKKALRTVFKFRREKSPISKKTIALIAVGVLVFTSIITIGVLTEDKAPIPDQSSQAEEQTEETASEPETEVPLENNVLTIENSSDLKKLLSKNGSDTDFWQSFYDKYQGRTLEFDGNISYMALTPGYKYTVDCLIEAGNFSETSSIGPPFRAPMVNVHTGFNLEESGERSTLFQGENIRIVARLVDYNPVGETFEIDIISTKLR
jgi:hypothetical protein